MAYLNSLTDIGGSIGVAPDYILHRNVLAGDGAIPTTPGAGVNMSGYRRACISVLPASGANPAAEVLFWSPLANTFVSRVPALTVAAQGADVPWETDVDTYGRIIFVKVTAGAKVAVAGGA